MILLWGLDHDSPLARVREWLEAWEADHVFVNHADVLEMQANVSYARDVHGTLVIRDRSYALEAFGSWYLRPYDFREFPHLCSLSPDGNEWKHAFAFDDALWSYADVAPARVLNRPSSMLSNTSKPLQWGVIRDAGLRVPETLITTSAEYVQEFSRRRGPLVYKSISGQRSIVDRLDEVGEKRLADLRWCPTQFQEFVDGTEYRVHVVGDEVFATRVVSDFVDYRYRMARLDEAQVPLHVAEACVSLAKRLGLEVAGIDLMLSTTGEWYCFEVNPSPAYSCYEERTGQPISRSIARFLVEAARASPLRRKAMAHSAGVSSTVAVLVN